MKDFPVFTTENGAASLILREIPYRREAYIHIRNSLNEKELLDECVGFCRACGAEEIFATGISEEARYPLHVKLIEMRGMARITESETANLWPVTEQTVSQWRRIYNEKMRRTSHARTLEEKDEMEIVSSGGAYFVHNAGDLYGIGWLRDNRIEAIASVKPGGGHVVMNTMLSLLPGEQIILEVASDNQKAISLYETFDFAAVREVSRWFRIL